MTDRSDLYSSALKLLNHRSSQKRFFAGAAVEDASTEFRLAVARIGVTDPDSGIRNEAADTLGLIGTRLDGFRIIQLLKDRNWMVRSTAIEAVERVLGTKGQEVLLPMLNDRHPIVRRDAAFVLGDLRLKSSIEFLRKRLRVEKQEQALIGLWAGLFALGEREYLERIVKLCLSSVPGLRTLVWGTINQLVEMGPLSSQELEIIRDGMEATRILAMSNSVRGPLEKLGVRLGELHPEA